MASLLRVSCWSMTAVRAPALTSAFQAMERKRQRDVRKLIPPFDRLPRIPKAYFHGYALAEHHMRARRIERMEKGVL